MSLDKFDRMLLGIDSKQNDMRDSLRSGEFLMNCPRCGGTGWESMEQNGCCTASCSACDGSGKVIGKA